VGESAHAGISGIRALRCNSGTLQVENFSFQCFVMQDGEHPYCRAEIESFWTAGAGVEIKHALAMFDAGPVGVAVEHGGESRSDGVKVKRSDVVKKIKIVVLEIEDVSFRQTAAWAGAVNIAADCVDGSDMGQGFENCGAADVAQMEDVFDACESGQHFRAKQTVGIADDTDLHRPREKI
jgi:hypothetical protein